MMKRSGGRSGILVAVVCFVLALAAATAFGANVSYDHRALVIDGKRRMLISGSIHYPRSTPDMWPDLIQKSKDGGVDVIETYVFWNVHEPVQNQYNFEGRYDLVQFIKVVAEAGLYVHLRIGPYVCAEWNYGGFPLWLHFIPGIKLRTDNEPYKAEMKKFTAKIVDMMKKEKLYASQGGPIILSQIENEYGNIDAAYGSAAKPYINWAANMAESLNTGVPWVMCQQGDAPDPIINTCNGFYCDQFSPNSKNKPKMWTENWSGWFLSFGGAVPYRPVEDLAFSVARFFQLAGSINSEGGDGSQIHLESLGHAIHTFVNGKLAGTATGNSNNAKISEDIAVTLVPGKNTIDLLSLTVGLQNYGAFFDLKGAGVTGPVVLKLKNGSTIDVSAQTWTYQIGLKGEDLGLPSGSSAQWDSKSSLPKMKPLLWYKTSFDAPSGNGPLAIDFTGMGKGEAWVNGQSIGRYWPTNIAPSSGCTDSCDYRGSYGASKCLKNCGKPSQTLYHVPRSWLKSSGNTLVLFEENGGDPTKIAFARNKVGSVCAQVSETHPSPVDKWRLNSDSQTKSGPVLSLSCPHPNQVISSIKFASYGTPQGTCGSFTNGDCHSQSTLSIIQKACVGSKSCSVEVSGSTFGEPCGRVLKSLAVDASCSAGH
ncbi:Beta-galactosidase 8 [Linum perenne]